MNAHKLTAGAEFPTWALPELGGSQLTLGEPRTGTDWQLVVVYRGKHCPMCTSYLKDLDALLDDFIKLGVDVVAVSADSEAQATEQISLVAPSYRVAYGLSVAQMRELGLYLSDPRSPEETDHVFAEPGIFVVNANRRLQIIDISNAPFARPELKTLLGGLRFVRNPDNNYPIRGTHNAS